MSFLKQIIENNIIIFFWKVETMFFFPLILNLIIFFLVNFLFFLS